MMMTETTLAAMCPVAYAKASNAEINARALAEGWSFWTLAPEDAAFYEGRGYTTALDYERATLIGSISDAYKEVFCVRPRGCYDWDSLSLDDLRAEVERLWEIAAEEAAAEEAAILEEENDTDRKLDLLSKQFQEVSKMLMLLISVGLDD